MVIKKAPELTYADVTPKKIYMGRRNLLLGLLATSGAVWGYKSLPEVFAGPPTGSVPVKLNGVVKWPYSTTEKQTAFKDVTTYNNYYEFGTDKGDPAKNSKKFSNVAVDRFRGRRSRQAAQVLDGRYFETCAARRAHLPPSLRRGVVDRRALDRLSLERTPESGPAHAQSEICCVHLPITIRNRCLSGIEAGIQLPYVEGLRLDEAMNPLALLCVGMYGETLPNQDGAPVRMVLPWKYGFKSIKSIVTIRLVEKQPPSTWNIFAPDEYGFYSNVNPNRSHPRWSQATEHRLGGGLFARPIPTQMFNGYADQVASMYTGMDLKKFY